MQRAPCARSSTSGNGRRNSKWSPTRPAGARSGASGPEDDDGASGHVLATVVADALDDRRRTRVPDREALADETAEESLARGRPVEDRVSRDHVLLGAERGTLRRPQREHPAGQALAD